MAREVSRNVTYSPFSMMRRFTNDLDRWFEPFSPWGWRAEQRFSPQIEVLQRDGKLIVNADLPGINKDDVHVEVSDNSLIIEGERKSEHEETEGDVYTCERMYGHFRREIPLPEGVKTDSAKANFKNGTLEITLDAPQAGQTRRRLKIGEETTGKEKKETAA
jgi:HSP20 family protein